MVDRGCGLSLSRQCALLGVSRSSQYYEPLGESADNLALMRRLDELHLEHPFHGSRQMARHLRREGVVAGRHRIRRLMRLMDMEAVYRKPRTSVANPVCARSNRSIQRLNRASISDRLSLRARSTTCSKESPISPAPIAASSGVGPGGADEAAPPNRAASADARMAANAPRCHVVGRRPDGTARTCDMGSWHLTPVAATARSRPGVKPRGEIS